MTSTSGLGDRGPAAEAQLRAMRGYGERELRRNSIILVGATLAEMVEWAGVAWMAQSLISFQAWWPGLTMFLCGGLMSALLGRLGRGLGLRAGAAIAQGAQREYLFWMFPNGGIRRGVEPAGLSQVALDLIDQCADFLAGHLPLRWAAPFSMSLILLATAVIHWPAAIILVLATAMMPANLWLAGMLAKDGNDRYLAALQRLGAIVLESFRGLPTLQRYGAVERRAMVLERASLRLQRANMAVLQRAFVSGAVMDTIVTLSIAVSATYIGFTLLGYVAVPGTRSLDLGSGLMVLLLAPMYFAPVRRAAAGFHDREQAVATAAVLAEVEPVAQAVQSDPLVDAPEVVASGVEVTADGVALVRLGGEFRAPSGVWTAVVGPSGAGKTTLLTVLGGLREPEQGSVLWQCGGRAQQPRVGGASWIGQDTVLLADTLAANLRLGFASADDDALWAALDLVGLGLTVRALPHGLATRCGVGGYAFSAGESRRIAIARAVLRGTRLWLLDEPTSHLDPESERQVTDALMRATAGATVVVVTHSPQVALCATRVYEVRDGVVEQRDRVGAPWPE